MKARQQTLKIKTPEGIVFSLRLASPISRFAALALDKAIVYMAAVGAGLLVRTIGLVSPDLAGAALMLVAFVLSAGYPIVFEWFMHGQTPGKKLLRLQVMDEQCLHLTFSQVVIRNLLRLVDAIPAFYLVGGLACVLTARAQRIGDVAANTIVVEHPRITEPDLDQVLPDKYNSFRSHPHLTARLRQKTGPTEAGLALQALLRRDQLEDAARLEVFAAIRAHMEAKAVFPPETVEGLSDEQYVRNAVDILFR